MIRERYRGALLGLAAGDALGTTLEFKSPGTFTPVADMIGKPFLGFGSAECSRERFSDAAGPDPAVLRVEPKTGDWLRRLEFPHHSRDEGNRRCLPLFCRIDCPHAPGQAKGRAFGSLLLSR
jgi:hypothetical protein